MISFPETSKQVADTLRAFPDARVGVQIETAKVDALQIEMVYVDADGNIVGEEANDYQPKDGETMVLMFSSGLFNPRD